MPMPEPEQLPLFAPAAVASAPGSPGFEAVRAALPRAERSWAEAEHNPRVVSSRSARGVARKLEARAAKPKLPTFAVQRAAILTELRRAGWAVAEGLKVPHATSPDGLLRYWFKTQAIYYEPLRASEGRFDLGDAHSLVSDMREKPTGEMAAYLLRTASRIASR